MIAVNGYEIPVISCGAAVVGSGAAGLAAAWRLREYGSRDIVLVTEGMNLGTSRNAGSDKQTYYKLSLGGGEPDSVRMMAETLYSGGCTDGDTALCEAALSAPCFLHLAGLGVMFPKNRYGEYIGYKTDHDPARRGSSAGPYTSKQMTECLERKVRAEGIRILDEYQVVRILTYGNEAKGLLCLNVSKAARSEGKVSWLLLNCVSIILATGAPAHMYEDSVYPREQHGATGLALEAGAAGRNLTEWQYGLASVRPRWNVSGTYMQALPVIVSVDEQGKEREFGQEESAGRLPCDLIFLKGYQWPFDVKRITGSSAIDLWVYRETVQKRRRVYLDYRKNPGGKIHYEKLSEEAREYLAKAGACFGTPADRLIHMNRPAYEFYLEHGVDLKRERLEIALCAQHNNGGIAVDLWWRTDVKGLFAAGEACGTHGIRRPGGAALNAGQAGAVRAAMYISARRQDLPVKEDEFLRQTVDQVRERIQMADTAFENMKLRGEPCRTPGEVRHEAAKRMSRAGGPVRRAEDLAAALERTEEELRHFGELGVLRENVGELFLTWDQLLCQKVYLAAMLDYIRKGGSGRGGAWYPEENGGGELPDLIQETAYREGQCRFSWRKTRPVPQDEDFFENVWREYREERRF